MKRFFSAASAFFLCVVFQLSAIAEPNEHNTEKIPPIAEWRADSALLAPAGIATDKLTQYDSIYILPETTQSIQDTVLPPCDIVFYKTGKLEYCKIIETTPTTISYKMCDYQDGPTIIVNKSDIHKIRYANGREDIIDVNTPTVKNAYVRANKKDVLATLSFIFGISTLGILLLFGVLIIPLVLAALVLGIISLIKINRRRGELRGKGSATLGILFATIAIVLILIFA